MKERALIPIPAGSGGSSWVWALGSAPVPIAHGRPVGGVLHGVPRPLDRRSTGRADPRRSGCRRQGLLFQHARLLERAEARDGSGTPGHTGRADQQRGAGGAALGTSATHQGRNLPTIDSPARAMGHRRPRKSNSSPIPALDERARGYTHGSPPHPVLRAAWATARPQAAAGGVGRGSRCRPGSFPLGAASESVPAGRKARAVYRRLHSSPVSPFDDEPIQLGVSCRNGMTTLNGHPRAGPLHRRRSALAGRPLGCRLDCLVGGLPYADNTAMTSSSCPSRTL